ncbi:MAG: GerMN domain-containing protein [Patescibacteria group bacterium]
MPNPNQTPAPKKSNWWLIIIAVIILLALLWPVFRRDKAPAEPVPLFDGEEVATTSEEFSPTLNTSPDSPIILPTGNQVSVATPGSVVVTNSTPAVTTVPLRRLADLALKVFFGNQTRTPGGAWQCNTVFPTVRTVVATRTPARAALTELLRGPSGADSTAGFFTSLNPDVTIKTLTISNGVARVDFGQPLITEVNPSTIPCLKDAARAQITETLKQFVTVRSVVISVNGVLF